MKKIKVVFLIAICILVALPLLFFNNKSNYVSPIDNRMLTEWRIAGGREMLDSYLSDRIGFRERAIDLYTRGNDWLFSLMVHPTYMYGKEGYVFLKGGQEVIVEDFIETFCAFLKKAQDYCENRGVPFIYCLNPGKIAIYSQYLPEGYNFQDKFNLKMYETLDAYDINWITNEELLKEASSHEQVYNIKYDAGHWNDNGCFYGTNNILRKVSEYFPYVKEHSRDDFDIEYIHQTTLPVSKFKIDEWVPHYIDKNKDSVKDVTDKYDALEVNAEHPNKKMLVNEAEGAQLLPRVLMFKGSYYNGREYFFESSFEEYDAIHNYENFIDLDYYFNVFKPDCVILETAEYATGSRYFNSLNMENKQFNPVLDIEAKRSGFAPLASLNDLEIVPNGNIVTITGELPEGCSRGYLIIGEKQFDFIIYQDSKTVKCAVSVTDYDDAANVYFE